jgi:hypothetical protein
MEELNTQHGRLSNIQDRAMRRDTAVDALREADDSSLPLSRAISGA